MQEKEKENMNTILVNPQPGRNRHERSSVHGMDALCDELLQEIFQRLPPATALAFSLVSKRWLRISRSSTTSLSISVRLNNTRLVSFLSAHPFLSSLSLISPDHHRLDLPALAPSFSPALTQLRLFTPPLSASSILSISRSCPNLFCLSITVSTAFQLTCLASFPRLNDLSLAFSGESGPSTADTDHVELRLETLALSGIRKGDHNLGWLWRSCRMLKNLKLKCCQGLGGSSSCLDWCFPGLQQVELRTCRTIVDVVLSKLAETSPNLNSLLIYDGGSREGLLHFIANCKSDLQRVDFRLPLDLDDAHLYALAQNSASLVSLRLQSCCLLTGQGLTLVAAATCDRLVELGLVSCDVLEREPGLLAALGQNLKSLKSFDLSYNEKLQDKEFVSLLGSCGHLNDLKLRGCRGLTNATLVSISRRNGKQLKVIDIAHCWKFEAEFVEMFVLNSPNLSRILVEESKITDTAKLWMWRKSIDHVFA